MLRTDKPYHVAWLWGLGSRKLYRRIRAVVALDWHCQYKSTRAPEYCSTGLALPVHLNPLSKTNIPCRTVLIFQHINILIDLIWSELVALRNVKKVGSYFFGWKELEGCQWQLAIRNGTRLMLPCRDISITSSSPALEQLMFYSVAWILSDCIEYVSSHEFKIILVGKPLNISLLKSLLTTEKYNLYRKPLWNLNELLANLRQGELIVEGRANLSCLVKREP